MTNRFIGPGRIRAAGRDLEAEKKRPKNQSGWLDARYEWWFSRNAFGSVRCVVEIGGGRLVVIDGFDGCFAA